MGILKGGFLFLGDLARELAIPARIDFLRVRSYGNGDAPEEGIEVTKDVEIDVTGKDVLIVEDIVDTGKTLAFLRRHLEGKNARSVRFCALVDKHGRRVTGGNIEFPGFRLRGGFLVGYGMDYGEAYRQLPQIYVLPPAGGRKHSDGGRR